jgi:hypothetical protein
MLIGLSAATSAAASERGSLHASSSVGCMNFERRKPPRALIVRLAATRDMRTAASSRDAAPSPKRRMMPIYRFNKNSRPDVQQIPCHAVPRHSAWPYELLPASRPRRAQPPEWLFESPAADGVSRYDQFGIPVFKGVPPIVILKPDRRK